MAVLEVPLSDRETVQFHQLSIERGANDDSSGSARLFAQQTHKVQEGLKGQGQGRNGLPILAA